MTQEQINGYSRSILKFMGYELKDYLWRKSSFKEPQYNIGKSIFDGDNTNSFEFHVNWNCLMKVVDKIESSGDYAVLIRPENTFVQNMKFPYECTGGFDNSKILNTFEACGKFVEQLELK